MGLGAVLGIAEQRGRDKWQADGVGTGPLERREELAGLSSTAKLGSQVATAFLAEAEAEAVRGAVTAVEGVPTGRELDRGGRAGLTRAHLARPAATVSPTPLLPAEAGAVVLMA
jgi:hypothetical protein